MESQTIENLIKQMRQELLTPSMHEKNRIALYMKQAHLIGKQEELKESNKTYQELIK